MVKNLRVNLQIKAPTVRLIGPNGEQLGIMAIEKARQKAQEAGFDLAEVAPNITPPVCKILDYGKYQYHQKKVETRHRKMQKKTEMKGIRIGFKTGEHDLMVKAKQAKKFLEAGNSVKVTLIFRGREAMYRDLAKQKMMVFQEAVGEVCGVEEPPKRQGNSLFMVLNPQKHEVKKS